jgi:hypothetical protein
MKLKGKKFICWKCKFLVLELGFLFRETKRLPCDKCLGKQTPFQVAFENQIWIKPLNINKEKSNNG